MKVAVIGATGLVGQTMMRVLKERRFNISTLIAAGSDRSKGRMLSWGDQTIQSVITKEALQMKPDIALFSAGSEVSLEWAPRFAEAGTTVIDNSSAWRMHAEVPLVVPEVNAHVLTKAHKIIANPNCSTIQLVPVLKLLHEAFGLQRVVISTYQSISGTGQDALRQYEDEIRGRKPGKQVYPYPIADNCLPQCDVFAGDDYTKEEWKLVNESRKILGLPNLHVTATAVRVPVSYAHSESVYIMTDRPVDLAQAREILSHSPGIRLMDNVAAKEYPMPLFARGQDDIFVGRLRRDPMDPHAMHCWIVADNVRKGAATNAVQIAELLME